jgi:hypothetical protein
MLERYKSPYSYYLDLLGEWPTGLALASQWFVSFNLDPLKRNKFFSNFTPKLNELENQSSWNLSSDGSLYLTSNRLHHSETSLMGCVFAKQVVLPKETISTSHDGLTYGGYQAPTTASNRSQPDNLSITMLETNASFLDLVIRPWIISVGYYGLMAREKNSPKRVKLDNVDVVMLAKAGQYNKMQIRKVYRFFNVAPISIEGETYSYAEDGMKYSNISFCYDNYSISDSNTRFMLNLK